jgi:hypothetical protein
MYMYRLKCFSVTPHLSHFFVKAMSKTTAGCGLYRFTVFVRSLFALSSDAVTNLGCRCCAVKPRLCAPCWSTRLPLSDASLLRRLKYTAFSACRLYGFACAGALLLFLQRRAASLALRFACPWENLRSCAASVASNGSR